MSDDPAVGARYRRATRSAERLLPDRAVVQLVDRPAVIELDGTAFCLWLALEEAPTFAEVVADLADVFGRDPATIGADIAGVLESLVRDGFVERV